MPIGVWSKCGDLYGALDDVVSFEEFFSIVFCVLCEPKLMPTLVVNTCKTLQVLFY